MGRKEDNIRKAQAIVHKPKLIRNIGTVAHIDHGKCVGARTRVWVDGEWIAAQDLWSRFSSRPAVANTYGADVREVLGDSLWTRSIAMDSGDPAFSQISHVWRLPTTESLLEIEARDGRRIRTTPEHPFVVASDMNLRFREASALKRGDMLAVPRALPSRNDETEWTALEERILTKLASDSRFLFRLTAKGKEMLGEQGPLRGKALIASAKAHGVTLDLVYPHVEEVVHFPPGRYSRPSGPINLPRRETLEQAFWFFGLLYGDGDTNGIIHSPDRKMLERGLVILRRLEPSAYIRQYARGAPWLKPRSKTFVTFLQAVFGYPVRRKSRTMRLPELLFTAPMPVAAAFIQGYMDADGTVEQARSAVSVTSVSEDFLDSLQLLFLRFGIRAILSRQKSRTTLYISGKRNLSCLPRFSHPEKSASQGDLERRAGTSYVVDLIPVQWNHLKQENYKARFYAKENQMPSTESVLSLLESDITSVERLLNEQVAFVEVRSIREVREPWVYDFSVPGPRNFVAEGFFVHNTTLSDSLIAGAGMMSQELAGQQLDLDFDEQEQARGITINSAIASMVHEFERDEYLINLIDTPGHVDFGGDVTRAMRAIDGAILVVDAVEGVMPQTETVIRQALKERVKPVLFINKVDRLIDELKIDPEAMQQRFFKIITEVNKRIAELLPDELKTAWQVKVEDGSVAFGSATLKWAISVPFMQETGLTFKDIYDYHQNEDVPALAERAPLHQIVLNMIIDHLPDPLTAQPLRIPVIWKGEADSALGKAMIACDETGPAAFVVTKIIVDPHAGEVAAGRLFSGRIQKGQPLWTIGMPKPERVQTVNMVVGPDRFPVDEIAAGNVVACVGLKNAISGSTVVDDPEATAFERIVHYSDPVVTVAIEAKRTSELPKLVSVLRTIAKADPSIQVEINEETGEHLMSGMGELHLEITQYRIVNEHKVEIVASEPIVVYRESVAGAAGPFEGKSPNKHNRFYLEVEPLEPGVVEAIQKGELPMNQRIKNARKLGVTLQELGLAKRESRKAVWIQNYNMLLDVTKGIQYLHETIELLREAFIEAANRGPLAAEKCMGVKVRLVDAKLHEDSIHRGPAQVIPAVRSAIYGAMTVAKRILLEPHQKVVLSLPQEVMGSAISELQSRRGDIEDIAQEGDDVTITAKAPVAEMFGFATAIRSATQGRALWSYENAGFEPVPKDLQPEVVAEIRTRKGLKPQPYDAAYYAA